MKREFLLFMSIPVAIIVLVTVAVQLPKWLAHPKYDFIYTSCATYECQTTYAILGNGQLSKAPASGYDYSAGRNSTADLYYFDTRTGGSRPITLAAANGLSIDTSTVSPDGYTLTHGSGSSGGFLLWDSSSDSAWYLKSGSKKKQVNLAPVNEYYSQDVKFLGWVKP